jgi:t-SNARE complex subunit (syntaxin)
LLSEQNSMTADGFKDQANHVDGNEWMAWRLLFVVVIVVVVTLIFVVVVVVM